MKKIYSIIAGLLMTASVFAQAPEKMSYQAVVRDGSDNLVTSTAVGMQISILQGTSTGTAVYVETQTPTSNANGLVSLEIGTGTVESGTFATIDWSAGSYFIKTETDPTGGANYTITGTSQLLSVPYALHAKTAGTNYTQAERDAITAYTGLVIYNTTTNKPNYYNGTEWMNYDGTSAETPLAIGDNYQGGKIAYILQSGDPGYDANVAHGIISAPSDQSTGIQWYNGSYTVTGATATALGTGNANTNTIVTNQVAGSYAAKLCNDLVLGGYSDWYLPSKDELNKLFLNRTAVGGFASAYYWSSTEYNNFNAWRQAFNNGTQFSSSKNLTDRVRAVRAF